MIEKSVKFRLFLQCNICLHNLCTSNTIITSCSVLRLNILFVILPVQSKGFVLSCVFQLCCYLSNISETTFTKKAIWHECFCNEDCVGQRNDTGLPTVFISDRKLVCPRQMSALPLIAHIDIQHISSSPYEDLCPCYFSWPP